ncbi:MAG: hypothetical protein J7L66_04330 [Anaerolineaceae bacterium]|nr:hypothetical protein [Anaerolineaceae bacterium]
MRKFIAVLFCLFLVFPLILAAQTTTSVISWALDKQFYIDVLNNPRVYETLTSGPMVNKFLHDQMGLPPEANTSDLESIINNILTPDYMSDQVHAIINNLFDYLKGKTDDFNPTVDITPLKTALKGSQQDAFLSALVAAMPTCDKGQTPGFGGQTACKPANISDEVLIEQILKPALPTTLSSLPDEIPVEKEWLNLLQNTRSRGFLPGMAVTAAIILGTVALTFFAICVWYITALVADSQWRGRLQWLGWMLLIPSAFIFLLGFTSQSGVPIYWIRVGLERAGLNAAPVGPELVETIQVILVSALPRIARAFQMVGGISGALSLTLILWSIATPRKKAADI